MVQPQSGQPPPIRLYLMVYGLLLLLSMLSYLVDYMEVEGLLRGGLIILFMLMKAGLIVSVFMHMRWERLALVYAILLPPVCLLALLGFVAAEADYTLLSRALFFGWGVE